jgi:hypothetical protein
MPAIIRWKEYPVGLVVGRDDHTTQVGDVVLPQVLLVHAQHVRRRGDVRLRVLVELVSIYFAEVTTLVDAQDHRLREIVVWGSKVIWGDVVPVPRPDRLLDRL